MNTTKNATGVTSKEGKAPPAAAESMPGEPPVTIENFVKWCCDHKGLAEAVCQAQAFAQVERERVRKYILPIFDSFGFLDEKRNKITDPDKLYLCEGDEDRVKEFYAQADAAHRANGFTGEAGVWPDLEAESLQMYAENELLEAAWEFLRMPKRPIGRMRGEFLKRVLSACLNVPASGAKGSKQS
jgi:hypothetical protein